jgi:uncharacterized protein
MSFAVDVNVLLYASDSASPHHEPTSHFLAACARRDELFCLTWPTVMSYLRISTHPAIFDQPLPPEDARSNIESILNLSHVRVLSEQEGFWEIYRRATDGLIVRGNLVADAHLAAVLLQNDIRVLYSYDSDFRKFGFLEVRPVP